MHKHLFKEHSKANYRTGSRITCSNRDPFSPNPVTKDSFLSQSKQNQYGLIIKNKQIPNGKETQAITIETPTKLQPQNAKLRIAREHVSTAQSNGSIKTALTGKDGRNENPLQVRTKRRLENVEEPQRQFKLINKIKGMRKLKLSIMKEQREIDPLSTNGNENDARSQGQRKTKKNDKTPQQQTVSSINSSRNSQDKSDTNSDFLHSSNSSLSQLGLQSKLSIEKKMKLSAFVQKVNNFDDTILAQIKRHLQIIEQIYLFVQESTDYCSEEQEWKELHFLLLKKYYLQRLKIVHFLKKYPMKNPFVLSTCKISLKDVLSFMNTQQGYELINQLQLKNKQIQKELSQMYDSFEKSRVGEKINLFFYDNVSQWIIHQLWIQFTLTEYSIDLQKQVLSKRLCRILQIIFLITEVNGRKLVSFESGSKAIETKAYQKYISQGKSIFQKEIQYQ